jgi:hypothetical protein
VEDVGAALTNLVERLCRRVTGQHHRRNADPQCVAEPSRNRRPGFSIAQVVIGDDGVRNLPHLTDPAYCVRTVGRIDDPEAPALKHHEQGGPYHFVVFDNEHQLAVSIRRRRGGRQWRRGACRRQEKGEAGTVAKSRSNFQPPADHVDQPLDDGKPQPQSHGVVAGIVADLEELFENRTEMLLGDADAAVDDVDANLAALPAAP